MDQGHLVFSLTVSIISCSVKLSVIKSHMFLQIVHVFFMTIYPDVQRYVGAVGKLCQHMCHVKIVLLKHKRLHAYQMILIICIFEISG